MKFTKVFKDFFKDRLTNWEGRARALRIMVAVIFVAIMTLTIHSSLNPQQVMLRTDEVAKRDIVSKINAVIVDEQQTEALRAQAAAQVQKSYQQDQYALASARAEVDHFYTNVKNTLLSEKETDKQTALGTLLADTAQRKQIISGDNLIELTDYLLITAPDDIDKMQQATHNILQMAMEQPITEEALPAVYEEAIQQANRIAFNPLAIEVIKITAIDAIRANMIYNQEATEQAIHQARESVQPVHKNVKAGEVIVRGGDRVSAEQISVLEQLGIQRTHSPILILLGIIALVLISMWLVREYLKRYLKPVAESDRLQLLLALIVVLVVLLTRFLTAIEVTDIPELNAMTGYLAPVAAGSMLIAILIDNRLAYFSTVIIAIFAGLLTESNQLAFVTAALVSGTVGVYRVTRLSQTGDLARAGLYIAGANVAAILAMILIAGNATVTVVLTGIILGIIGGILSAVLTIGVLPYLESVFSITSMIRLLELSNPNHALLRRLLMEAPGTYHHSLMVGNLAEASADAIGANSLLVRVGAYYHDIGKIKRPEYFVENQRGLDEPHNKIAPALSALIIISHVKEGVELAREAHLPQVIVDFIASHHGTSITKYFYNQAIAEEGEGMVNENSFRYEGPKPQTKEVALVMLADAVEAAVRSLPNPNLDNIRTMVYKIIREKLNDGQLEECDLTFKDLDVLARSFCTVLEGVYHKRIEYPDLMLELTKGRVQDGNDDNKPAG